MKRLVLPEGGDERIREAARRIEAEGIAQAIVFDSPPAERIERYAELYVAARPDAAKIARRLVSKPLYYAGMMVKAGDADAMLAGVSHPTARIIEAGLLTVGLAEGIRTPSSFFLMKLPDRSLVYADCAVNADPDAGAARRHRDRFRRQRAPRAGRRAARRAAFLLDEGQREARPRGQGPARPGNRPRPRARPRHRRRTAGRRRARAGGGGEEGERRRAPSRAARTSSSSPTSTPATSPTSSPRSSPAPTPSARSCRASPSPSPTSPAARASTTSSPPRGCCSVFANDLIWNKSAARS